MKKITLLLLGMSVIGQVIKAADLKIQNFTGSVLTVSFDKFHQEVKSSQIGPWFEHDFTILKDFPFGKEVTFSIPNADPVKETITDEDKLSHIEVYLENNKISIGKFVDSLSF